MPEDKSTKEEILKATPIINPLFSSEVFDDLVSGDKEKITKKGSMPSRGIQTEYSPELFNDLQGTIGYKDPLKPIPLFHGEDFLKERRAEVQTIGDRVVKGFARTGTKVLSEIAKLPGYIIGAVDWGLSGGFDDSEIGRMVDNAWINTIQQGEDYVKNEVFPVYTPKSVQEGGLWANITSSSFWATEGADGVGFLLSMLIPGQVLKAGKLGTLGAKGIGKVAKVMKPGWTGIGTKGITGAIKGADTIDNIGAVAVNTLFESASEAGETFDKVKNQLIAQGYSEEEAKNKAGESAVETLLTNFVILLGPNALTQNQLFKAFSRTKGMNKLLGADGGLLSDVAKKSFKQNLPLFGKDILKTISSEGFFEEGLQFASSQYFEDKALGKADDYDTYMEGILDTYLDNLDNVDMQKSIFLGGVLGGGMSIIGTKNEISAENARLFGQSASNPNKFKKLLGAKERPEQKGLLSLLQNNYLSRYNDFEQVYKKDAQGNFILNAEGKREVDPAKLEEFKANVINADAMNVIQQAALEEGNELTYDYFKNIKDFQYMLPYLQQPEGMDLLLKHIEHLAEKDADYIKDVLQQDSSKTTQEIKAELINKAKKFQKIYESVEGTHDVFNKIRFNKEDEVAFKDYSADLKSAKMSMAITQDFLESKIQELTNKALSIDPRFEVGKINPELVSPQKNAEIEKINKELKALTESLEESIKESKNLYNEKTQQKLYEEYLANKKEVEKKAKNTEATVENFTRDIENAGYKVKANENSIDVLDRSVQGIHLLFKGKPYRLVRLDNEDKSKEGTYLVNDSNQSIKINAAWVKENYKSIQVIPIEEARESIRSRRVKAIKDNSVKAIIALTNEFESKKKAIDSDISKLEDDILDTMIELEEIQENLKKGIGHKSSLKKAIRKAEETIVAIEKQVEELRERKKNIDDVITTLEQYKQRVINENIFSFKKELTKLEEEVDRDGINSLPELIKISSELDELITNLETQKVKLENYLDILYTIDAESRLTEALLLKDIEVAWFKEKYKGLNYRTTIADVRKMSKSVSNFINTKRGDKSKLEFVNEIIEDLNTLNDLEESAKRSLEELQFVSSEITANEEELSKLNTNLKELKDWRARVELKKPLLTLATLYDALKKRYEKYKAESELVVPENQVSLDENNEPTNNDNNSSKSFITIIDNTALSTELWFTTGKNIMYDEKGTEYNQNGVPSVTTNEHQKRWFSFTQKVELKDEKGHDKYFIKIVSPQQEFPGFEDLQQQIIQNLKSGYENLTDEAIKKRADLVALVIDKSTGQPLIYNDGYVFTSINTPSRLFDNRLNVTIPTIVSNYQSLTGTGRFDALTKEGGFYNPSTGHFHQSNLAGTVEVTGDEAISIMVDKVRDAYEEQFKAIHKALLEGAKINIKIKGISNGIPQKYKRNEDGTKRLKPVKSQLSLDNATIVLNKFGIPVIEYPDGRYAYLDRRKISPLEADLIIALLAKTVTTSSKEGLTIFNIDAKVPLPKGNYLAGNPKKTSVDIIPHRQGELGLLSLLINWGGPGKGKPFKEGHVYVNPISMEIVFMYNNSIETLPLNLVDDNSKNQLFKEFLESRPININKGALSNDKFVHFQPKLRGGNIDFETFSSYTDFLTSGKESPLQTDIIKSSEAEGIQFASRNFALNTNPSGRLVIEPTSDKTEIKPDVLPQEYDPENIEDIYEYYDLDNIPEPEPSKVYAPGTGPLYGGKTAENTAKESPGMSALEILKAKTSTSIEEQKDNTDISKILEEKEELQQELKELETLREELEKETTTKNKVDSIVEENITPEEIVELQKEMQTENVSEIKEEVKKELINALNNKSVDPEKKTILQKVVTRLKKLFLALMITSSFLGNSSFTYHQNKDVITYENINIKNLESWNDTYQTQQDINNTGNVNIINTFQENQEGQYIIVDKVNGLAHLHEKGNLISTYEVGTGKNTGDEQTKTVIKDGKIQWDAGNKQTGAGIYTVSNQGTYKHSPSYTLLNERGIEVSTVLHETLSNRKKFFKDGDATNNRMSYGCINFLAEDIQALSKTDFKGGSKVYILPDNPKNTFKIIGGELKFISQEENVNKSVTSKTKADDIHLVTSGTTNNDVKEFFQSLSDNKKELMDIYSTVSNDEYNLLSTLAYGIIGQESSFGTYGGVRGQVGRIGDIGKNLLGQSSSVGIGQVKLSSINKKVRDKFGIKDQNDLFNVDKNAIAIIAILLDNYVNTIPNSIKSNVEAVKIILPMSYNDQTEYKEAISNYLKKGIYPNNAYSKKVNKWADQVTVYTSSKDISSTANYSSQSKKTSNQTPTDLAALGLVALLRKRKEENPDINLLPELDEAIANVKNKLELLNKKIAALSTNENPFSEADKLLVTPDYKRGNIKEALKNLEKIFGTVFTQDDVKIISGLIEGKSLGRFTRDGKILLSDELAEGTEYHEAFHRVFRVLIGEANKQDLINEFKTRKDYLELIEAKRKEGYTGTEEKLIEEVLADEFMEYMLSGKLQKPEGEKSKSVFQRMWEWLKKFLGVMEKPSTRAELFSLIKRGGYKHNFSKEYFSTDSITEDADKLKVGDIELTPAETTALMKGLTTELLNLVYDKGAIYKFLNSSPSDLKKAYALSIRNALDKISNKISSLEKEALAKEDEGLASDSIRLSSIYLAINSNKDSIIKKHSEYLKEFNITIDELKADETTSDEESIPEDQRKKQAVEWTPSVEISVKERMTRAIKLMAATLPKISKIVDGVSIIESNDLGLVESEDYRKITAQLFNILAGVPADPYRFIEEIEKSSLAKYAPILKQRLGFGDKSFGKQKLRNEFTQAFAKTKLNFITGVINFDGSVSIVNSNSQAVRDSIIQEWGSNISAAVQNNPGILTELNKYKNSIPSDKVRAEIYRLLDLEVNEKLLSDSYFDNALLEVVNAVINSKDGSINETVKALQKRNSDKGASKSFRTLAEAQAKYDVNNELQVFNADNKLVYSVTLNSYQSQIIDGLNYFGYEKAKEYFPHLYNVYTTNSKWLGNIKAEKKMRNLLLDGFKSEGKEAMKIDNLKEADLYSFFLNGLLTQGIYPSMKHADRSLIPAYQFDDRSLILPIERDAKGLEAQAQLIMRGYLADEVNRYKVSRTDIQNYDTNLDGKPGQYNPLGNVLFNNPEINRIWKRILQDTKNKSIVTPKDLDLEYVNTATQDYLNSMATEMEFTLKKHNVGVNNAGVAKELIYNKESKTGYSFSHIVKAFAWNTYFGNIEQIKLFSGDVALYSKPDEFFKRLNMQSSTGEVCVVNEENNNYISDLNRAVNLTINGKVIKYKQSANGLSQEIVLADNQFSSSVLSSIEMMLSQGLNEELTSVENSNIAAKTKEYTEELVGAYEDFIENDGFSFTNIFEWREWLHRAGKWSKEAENVFNREIEWLNIEHSNLSPEEKKKEQYKLFTPKEGVSMVDYINKYNGVPVIYKPQYTGPVYQNTLEEYTAEDPATRINMVAGRKTSFLILMPSMIKGTPLETLNNHLLSTDTGFVFWNGSAKFGTNKITSAFYNKEGKFDVNAIAQVPRTNLDYRFLKHQLEISNKPKEFIPNSTQSAKNMIANMYSKGTPKSELAKEHFEEYNRTIENLIQRKIEKFLKDIDTVIVTESKEFDKLPTYNIKSLNKFKEVLLAAAKSRNSARNILEAIDEFNKDGKFTFLEGLPNKERINSILNSMITSSVLVLKRPGNAMPQASIMGLETEGRELVNNNRIKSSTESLKFYEPIVKDGKIEGTNKAEFIIPLPHKWIDWVMKAANTNSLEEAIDWINNEIAEGKLDTELTTKDLRIPNQQTSSNDIFKVKKFINPLTYASIAFVPSELVAKTGGDFDIDKLQIYYKNLVGDSKAGLKAIKFLDNSNSTEQKRYDNLVYEKYKNILKPLQIALGEMSKDIKTKTNNFYELNRKLQRFEELSENPGQKELDNIIFGISEGIKDMDEAFEVEDTLKQEEEDVITLTLKRDQLIEELQKIKSAISNEFSFEEFKKLSIENQNTKEAVENRLLEIEEKILLAPYNIRNLMTAVSDDYLKNTLMPKITKKTLGQAYTAKQYGENSNSWHNIPSPLNNVNKLLEFLWGSQGIGIIATEITHAAVAQAAGVKVNPYFNVTKNGETKPFSTEIPFEIMKGIYDFSASHDVLSERQITDILSGLLNTQVDVVKNPYPLALGIMLQSLPVITYMVRRGVPLEYTLQFITSKSIQEYLLKQRNNQSFVAKSKGRKSMFNPNGMVVDNEVLSNEILEKYPIIEKGKYLTLKDLESNANTYQGNILDAYLNIVEQAKAATDVKKLLSPDTKYYKTMEDAKQVYTTLIKDIKASDIISSSDIQNVLDTTFLGAFYEGNRMYYALFKNLSKFETASTDVVEAIEKNLEVTLKTQFTQEAKEKTISLFYNELITYIIQNNSDDFKGAFEKLFEGDKSLAKRVIKAKKRKEFKDNQFIQLLLPEVNRRENGRDNLRMKQQGFQTIEINSLLDYLEEVSQYDNELYEDLVKFSFMQSGIGNSPYNYSKLLDNAGLSKYRDVFNNAVLSKSDINNFFIKFQEANPSLFDSKEEVENTIKDSVFYQNYRDTILENNNTNENVNLNPIKSDISNKVLEGDIFSLPGIPVITTNLGGVHGAGLAQLAKSKGLIKQGEGSFKSNDRVVQFPVKMKWSDSMATGNNMLLLQQSLNSLIGVAKENPSKTYLLPLAGLGHGEGSVNDILPLLIKTIKEADNIKLVLPTSNVNLGRQGTVRKDYTRENLPIIKKMLSDAGVLNSTITKTPSKNIVKDFINSLTNEQKAKLKKHYRNDNVIRIINEHYNMLSQEEAIEAIKCNL